MYLNSMKTLINKSHIIQKIKKPMTKNIKKIHHTS
jgi:hypothetical protein